MNYEYIRVRLMAVLSTLLVMGPWTGVFAAGSGSGYLSSFKVVDSGANNTNKVLAITLNTNKTYVTMDGLTVSGGFSAILDQNGLCPDSMSGTARAALVINSLSDSVKKTSYTMLMSAALINRPVRITVGNCIKDNSGSVYWEITGVQFP